MRVLDRPAPPKNAAGKSVRYGWVNPDRKFAEDVRLDELRRSEHFG